MAQTGDFLKSAGGHASTAAAAAAAAQAARPGGERGGVYAQEFSDFTEGLSAQDRKLLPDPERVRTAHIPDAPPGISGAFKDPVKINLGSSSLKPKMSYSGGGKAAGFSAASPEFTPAAAQGAAPVPGADAAYAMQMAPGFGPYMGNYASFGGMPMGGYPMYGMDPFAGMGGKGGMPFMPMFPSPYPMGMPPGMMPPPQTAGGGGQKGSSKEPGGGKEKTRERRKRKKRSNNAAEEVPESDEAAVNRSEELNEVRRAGQGKSQLTLEQVLPQAFEFATDQHGSRFLQTKLDESEVPEKLAVFEALLPQTKLMSKDQFGNFVVQKLFDIGTSDQKRSLADQLEGDVLALSMDQHGCRVIQKALQLLPRDAQTKLAMELTGKVDECIQNMHGNHVIQKCIEQMPPDSVNFIIDGVSERVEFLAEHMYGCRVIQRLLEHCAPHQLQVMFEKIEACTEKLSQNLYGNYVVQHMLEHGRPEDKKRILRIVTGKIMDFARNKCSSNVVEKCFEIATIGEHADALKEDRARLVASILEPRPGEAVSQLQQLTEDKFGNYIVQRMLEHSKGAEREELKTQLLAHVGSIQHSANGKHILMALQKEFGLNLQPPDNNQ